MLNEEKVAAKCIDKVISVIKKLKSPLTLLIVNDGSNDDTAYILKEKLKMYKKNMIVLTHKRNKGYGAATQTGIKFALQKKYSWILHMDSDLTNDPKYISSFLKQIPYGYDCIKASRYIRGGKVLHVSKQRLFISLIGNIIAQFLFEVGIKDCTNGFRMVKLEKLKGLTFHEKNFSIILEELYYLKKRKAKFTEIPYTLTARKNSASHFTYKPKIFIDYFKYALKSVFL